MTGSMALLTLPVSRHVAVVERLLFEGVNWNSRRRIQLVNATVWLNISAGVR